MVEASEVWFKELERSESPPLTPPQESSKGAPGAQGDCPRRPELSFSHGVPIDIFLSQFLPPVQCSFPSLLSLPTSPSLFLRTPWPTLTLRCRTLLGSRSQSWAPGPRSGAGHLAPRPGGRWLRKLRTNPGVRPAPRPCPRHPLISSCHLPMLPLWKSHQRSRLPLSAMGATAGPPLLRSWLTLSSHLGHPGRPRPLNNKPRLSHCLSLPILRPSPSLAHSLSRKLPH